MPVPAPDQLRGVDGHQLLVLAAPPPLLAADPADPRLQLPLNHLPRTLHLDLHLCTRTQVRQVVELSTNLREILQSFSGHCEASRRFVDSSTDRSTIHTHLCWCLLLAHLVLLLGLDATSLYPLCYAVAVTLHFLFLAAFSWMLAEGLELSTNLH